MNIAHNFHRSIVPAMFVIVRNLWETHNPSVIADTLNARYSLWGKEALDCRAVENMRQRIRAIDRGEIEG